MQSFSYTEEELTVVIATDKRVDERIESQVLTGGFSVYVLPKSGFSKRHAILSVDFGSIDVEFSINEKPERVPLGTSHFLEHRLFEKGTGDVTGLFAAMGADLNAYTGLTNTSFLFTCVDRFEDCLGLLMDFVLQPDLSSEGIEKERKIISREIQLYGDSLEWVSFFSVMRSMYPEHPLSVDMAGTLESIGSIELEHLRLVHDAFYHPANMSLFVSGDVDPRQVIETVSRLLPDAGGVGVHRSRYKLAAYKPGRRELTRLNIFRPRVCVGFRDSSVGYRGLELLQRELAAELALDIIAGASSRFYRTYYEQGLIDLESFGYDVYAEPEFSYCMLGGDSEDPQKLEEAILELTESAVENVLTEEEFQRAKRKSYGHLLQQFDQVDSCAGLMESAATRGADPFDFISAYELLSCGDLQECFETWLCPDNAGISVVLPEQE